MPKVQKLTSKYIVSFNGSYEGIAYGDEYMHTANYEGNNVAELAAEVNVSDPNYPLEFKPNPKQSDDIIGFFYGEDDTIHSPAAVMMTNSYFYSN